MDITWLPHQIVRPLSVWRTDTFEPITVANAPIFIVSLAWNSDSTRLAEDLHVSPQDWTERTRTGIPSFFEPPL